MDVDFEWLVGKEVSTLEWLGHSMWLFRFGSDAEVRSECPWRIIQNGCIALSSVDHGHKYGLPAPIDAELESRKLIVNKVVNSAICRKDTRDFIFGFGSELRLELIPLSTGYESWQVYGPDGLHVIAMGGGELAVWGAKQE